MNENLLAEGKHDQEPPRTFRLHDHATNVKAFCDNSIRTSKYSAFPFSPRFAVWKNLFEQFHRYANCYFLVVATLQLLPGLSPTGQFTTIIPLSLVLFVTFCKDVFEDYRRHQRDAEVNSQTINVYRNNTWQMVLWRDISVGDLVEVARDISRGEFPADLLLLWSTEDDGLCHIETSNLDGETNLKLRKSHSENAQTQHPPFSRSDPSTFQGNIFCQPPNKDLYNFEGRLIRGDRPEDTSAIGIDSILLRGAKLGGSTKKVVGLVVYTGSHSKLMMNQQATRHKASSLESMTNRQIIFIFIFDIILCSTCAAGLGVSTNVSMDHWYLAAEDLNPVWTAVTGVATFIILFNNLIPISLYVSMEMVKIVQAQLIGSDLEMYHGATDTPANARTSSLNEELGQIQYIFSDKTGTLTCNIMDFLKFSVGEMSYGTGTTEIGRAAALREGRALRDDRPPGIKLEKGFFFYDDRVSDVHGQSREWRWMHQPNRGQLEHFFKILAVCHTVVTEEETDESGQPVLTYTAASPDENCLVCGMRYLGIKFIGRDATHVSIEVAQANGKPTVEKWRLYEVIEFNSDRKRMSIITRDPMGRLYLLTKGADTVIYDRLRRPVSREEESTNRVTKTTLERFGADGLRTLCVAQVQLEEAQYAEWAPLYKAATESVGDRQKKVDAAAELIERNLELVGTTAIEDKLQDGVPQAIELLRTAGLNVWVLTGDKQETAINIGYACALLHSSMEVFKFDENAPRESIGGKIREFMHDAQRSKARNPNIDVGVVIQGATLVDVTSETAPLENKENFLKLTEHCKAVICCRVTPGQKAEIVRLVKDGLGQVTLSIGDGANDVAMITEAHVGIGISGLEGMQAARAADYAIGQFRFLVRLLLVHGRWSYRRVSKVILYSFYKNILLYLTQFWFCFCNFFTGQSLYDRWALASFNLAFTALPIMAVGIFDRDIETHRITELSQFPELYDEGRLSLKFNTKVFWQFTSTAAYQSACCFFIPMIILGQAAEYNTGHALGMHWLGMTTYTCVIWVVTLKCALETRSWTRINHLVTWGSLATWYVFIFVYGNMYRSFWPLGPEWYKLYEPVLVDGKHWLTVVLTVTVALFRDVTWKFYQRTFRPSLQHKVEEWEQYKRDGVLPDFNYNLMRRECPQVLPRQRVKMKRFKTVPDMGQHQTFSGTNSYTDNDMNEMLPLPGSRSRQTSQQPAVPAHQHGNLQHSHQNLGPEWIPGSPVLDFHSAPGGFHDHGHHTGYAFSQSDNQVEAIASRVPGQPEWAHPNRKRRASRVVVGRRPSKSLGVEGEADRSKRGPEAEKDWDAQRHWAANNGHSISERARERRENRGIHNHAPPPPTTTTLQNTHNNTLQTSHGTLASTGSYQPNGYTAFPS